MAIFLGNPSMYLEIYTLGKFFLKNKQNVHVLNVFPHVLALTKLKYDWLLLSEQHLFKYWRIYNSSLSLFSSPGQIILVPFSSAEHARMP